MKPTYMCIRVSINPHYKYHLMNTFADVGSVYRYILCTYNHLISLLNHKRDRIYLLLMLSESGLGVTHNYSVLKEANDNFIKFNLLNFVAHRFLHYYCNETSKRNKCQSAVSYGFIHKKNERH